LAILVSAMLVLSCGQTDRQTESHTQTDRLERLIIIISFIGFGSQEGWITTDIKTYITNSKTVSTHQLSDESQSVIKFSAAILAL